MPPTQLHGPAPPVPHKVEPTQKCPPVPKVKTVFPPVAQQEGMSEAQSKAPVVKTSTENESTLEAHETTLELVKQTELSLTPVNAHIRHCVSKCDGFVFQVKDMQWATKEPIDLVAWVKKRHKAWLNWTKLVLLQQNHAVEIPLLFLLHPSQS